MNLLDLIDHAADNGHFWALSGGPANGVVIAKVASFSDPANYFEVEGVCPIATLSEALRKAGIPHEKKERTP